MVGSWLLTIPGKEAFAFGCRSSGYPFASAPAVGMPDMEVEDFRVQNGDGLLFGADHLGGQTITFEVDVSAKDRAGARRLRDVMRSVWRADPVRTIPGAVAELRSEYGRVTFGRPRRFSSNDDEDHFGISRVTADFATVTDLWFGDVVSASVGFVPIPEGGLVAPLSSPLSTTASSDRSQAVEVGGELPTPVVVTIEGPITNPVVEIGPVRLELRTTLAYDQTLTIDASPWARTILRDGAAVPGVLTPQSTRLADAVVPPGVHEFVLRGSSQTGAARAVVSWRPAFYTP